MLRHLRFLAKAGEKMKQPCVYILASGRNGTLYTGMTTTIWQRLAQHRTGTIGFTHTYGCRTLVYLEWCETIEQAYAREKQIKGGSRKKKLALIESINPDWKDLSLDLPYA